MNAFINWMEESKTFDEVSETYDLYRPSYPDALINKVIEVSEVDSTSRLLEIGAGSGKATELFINRDLNVHCIEQGPNLVEKGCLKFKETNQVTYECIAFQDWEVEEDTYDLVFSAQAFHWIPKPKGYKNLAKTLKQNGHMMIFWNKYINTGDEVSTELSKLLKEHKLLNMLNNKELETFKNRTYDGIFTTDRFKEIEIFEYPWQSEYSYNDFINFLSTTNRYISLESQEKQEVNVRLMEIFSKYNYKITLNFNAVLFSARKC